LKVANVDLDIESQFLLNSTMDISKILGIQVDTNILKKNT